MNNNSKELMKFRKNFLITIKEKLKQKKQEMIESHIDPSWLKAFYEANKERIDGDVINVDSDITEEKLSEKYNAFEDGGAQKFNIEDIHFDNIDLSNEVVSIKNTNNESILNTPEKLKEAYKRIKNGDCSMDSYSNSDLLKIYSVMIEELQMTNDLLDDDEIEELEKENEELRKEIEKLDEENQ